MGFYSVILFCAVLGVFGIAKFVNNEEKIVMLYALSTLLFIFYSGSIMEGLEYQRQCEVLQKKVTTYEQEFVAIKTQVEFLKEETELLRQKAEELKAERAVSETRNKNTQYKQGSPIIFEATAYSSSETSTVTASGETARHGIVAVDPNIIPLGTSFYAEFPNRPEYNGVYYAGDTGGAIGGNIIDVFIDDYDRAMAFGRQECHVYLR